MRILANDMDRNQSKRKDTAELKDLDDAISNLKILTRSVSVYRYDKVHLGLAQTIISKCFKGLSQRASFVITVLLSVAISVWDTTTDLAVAYLLYVNNHWEYALVVLICDYLPGWQLALHNLYSETWRKSTNKREKIVTLCFLLMSPFSQPLFHLNWLIRFHKVDRTTFNVLHHNARLSQLLNSSVESPLQITILLVLWGEGILSLPWHENQIIVDSQGNILDLGALPGICSLLASLINIIQGYMNIAESESCRENFMVCSYAISNIAFRLGSFSLSIIFFKEWSITLFITIGLINIACIYQYDKYKRKRFSVVTSAVVSMFTPLASSDQPHQYQTRTNLSKRRRLPNVLSKHQRNLSANMSLSTLPPILICDITLFLLLRYHNNFKYNLNIILEKEEALTILSLFLFPISLCVIIVSIKFRALSTTIATKDVNHFSGMEIASLLSHRFTQRLEQCWRFMIMVLVLVLTAIMGFVTITSLSRKDNNVKSTERSKFFIKIISVI